MRLWSAHYGLGEHICGPNSCKALSIEADGTQWTSSALGRVLDQSELQSNFFTVSPTNGAIAEAELESGELNTGKNALTNRSPSRRGPRTTSGSAATTASQHRSRRLLRVAIYDTGWHITQNVVVDGSKGLHVMAVPQPGEDRSGLGGPDGRGRVPRRLRRLLNTH